MPSVGGWGRGRGVLAGVSYFCMASEKLLNNVMTERQRKAENGQFETEDVIDWVLVRGTDDQMKGLYAFLLEKQRITLSWESFLCVADFAKQRNRFQEDSYLATKRRKQESPLATKIEYVLGTYLESLEYPVRDAVVRLRERGYCTFQSGFDAFESQAMVFDTEVRELSEIFLPSSEKVFFAQYDAVPFITPKKIGFRFQLHRPITDDELKMLWDRLVDVLPVLRHPQGMTWVGHTFREEQDRLVGKRA